MEVLLATRPLTGAPRTPDGTGVVLPGLHANPSTQPRTWKGIVMKATKAGAFSAYSHYPTCPDTIGSMADPTTQTVTERKSALIMAGGRIRLDDATVELLGGTGAWINVDVIDGVVTLRPSILPPEVIEAVLGLPLDTDES
jgi:hypothetical protein